MAGKAMPDMLSWLIGGRLKNEASPVLLKAYNAKGAMFALWNCLASSKISLSLLTITQRRRANCSDLQQQYEDNTPFTNKLL